MQNTVQLKFKVTTTQEQYFKSTLIASTMSEVRIRFANHILCVLSLQFCDYTTNNNVEHFILYLIMFYSQVETRWILDDFKEILIWLHNDIRFILKRVPLQLILKNLKLFSNSFVKKKRRVFALFKSILSRNRSLSNAR